MSRYVGWTTAQEFATAVVIPALELVQGVGGPPPSAPAVRFLTSVARQESNLRSRYQVLSSGQPGPARGFWQFERAGVSGVLRHVASAELAERVCRALMVEPSSSSVWRAIEGHDVLAGAIARLLLWTDPYPIPEEADAAWRCYAHRLWRPGKPHERTWPGAWADAQTVQIA